MLPFVLLACAWWQRNSIVGKDVMQAIPFFALSGVLGLVTVWFQYDIGEDIVRTDSFLSRLAGAGWAVWFYLYKTVIPYNLSFVYPRWEINASSIVSYLPAGVLLACFAVFWRYRRGWGRGFLFGVGYYVVTLFPVLGFFNIYFMKYSLVADHWQYTSIIGIIALFVGLGMHLKSQCSAALQRFLSVATVCLICLLCVLTWRQEHIYKDVETLWRHTISKNPEAWLAHNNLGIVLDEQGRLEEAIVHFSEAVRIKADYADAHNNMGLARAEQGSLTEAIHHYSEALRIKPDYADVYNNIGVALAGQGQWKEAIDHYSEALRIKPDHALAHNNMGLALVELGKLKEAIYHYEEALHIKPDLALAHNNLGVVFAEQGRLREAIARFSQAVRIKPDYANAKYNLEFCLRQVGGHARP
jgi:Tfp pilus assembly protein PilF